MMQKTKVLFNYKKIQLIGFLNKHTRKERAVIAISGVLITVGLFYALVISYYGAKLKKMNIEKMNMQATLMDKKKDIENVKMMLKKPDAAVQLKQITDLKTEQKQLMDQLRELNKTSYTPAELSYLLYDLLLNIKTLKILNFTSVEEPMVDQSQTTPVPGINSKKPTSSVNQSNATKPANTIKNVDNKPVRSGVVNPGSNVAKIQDQANAMNQYNAFGPMGPNVPGTMANVLHPNLVKQLYTLTLEGKYLDVYKYLELIESKKLPVYWQSLDYKVKKQPVAVVDIKFYAFDNKETP